MGFVLFGLTGGIACGKSTVAARFREHGVEVIDADQVARLAVAPGTSGLAEVVKAFGEEVLRPDRTLDRQKLAAIVFDDDEKRLRLNKILHPRIAGRTMLLAQELAERGEKLACYEATLIVENGMADAFRPLVVVTAPEAVQVARVMSRDGATEAAALARIRAQMPLEEKVKAADYVIENAGDLEATLRQADEVLEKIRAKVEAGG
ncbi:dephospho-CoA kinase [Polyangium aurulentum]|uniref:dephospho-CoA kinase n=1 Tax=Polyangium aurulentum TaxID=2567896 RepID=UPI0010AEC38F|nr:dephospho-CoA kinase [Polyangium aurulentum]UQA56416.1 dephospho-CoA kinase [Polyangium aurulentum]